MDGEFSARHKRDPQAAIRWYREYMVETEDEPLPWGTGYPLVRALLGLNQYAAEGEPPLVEVVVMSRNSPETSVRARNAFGRELPAISRSIFTDGSVQI
jgi:5'-nucleotidase